MKRQFRVVITILYMALFFEGIKLEAHAEDKKVIAIVYDDSSSMTFDSAGGSITETKTKWVEADYAVRAFVGCKNPEDEIVIFPMNKVSGHEENKGDEQEIIIISEMDKGDTAIQEKIDKISVTFYDDTPYGSVETALNWLENKSGDEEAEKWLIILTDGEFFKEKKEKIEKAKLREELEGSLRSSGAACSILYVPLEEGGELDGEDTNQIKQIKEGNGIQQKILAANNEIYKRKQLSCSMNEDGININIDVPLSELIIIRQKEGEEYQYNEESEENNGAQDNEKEEEQNIESGSEQLNGVLKDTGKYNYQRKEFQSYGGETPSYKGKEIENDEFQDSLMAKDISGTIEYIRWEYCDISEENNLNFTLKPEKNESITLYYQLKFDLEIEVMQGVEIVTGEEINNSEYEVNIYPVLSGEDRKRVSVDASLFDEVDFYLNGEPYALGQSKKGTADIGEEIELKAKAESAAMVPVEAVRKLNVVESIYPINISIAEKPNSFTYDMLLQNRTENHEGIKINLAENTTEGEIQLRDTTKNNLVVEAKVSYKGLKEKDEAAIKIKTEHEEGKDEWYLYPYLVNENDLNEYEEVQCTITAYRRDQAEESKNKEVVDISLAASPIELEAFVPEDTYSIWDVICGKIKPRILRNGTELPEERWRNIKYAAMDGDASKHIVGGRWNIARLLEIPYWFFYGKDEIIVYKEVKYVERGIKNTAILAGVLAFHPSPVWIRGSLIGILILIVLIGLWAAVRVLSGRCFGWGFRAYICLTAPEWQISEEEMIRPKRRWRHILLPGKSLRFVLSNNDDRKPENFPDINIRRDKKENKLVIVNGADFERKNFRVNDIKLVDRLYMDPEDCIKIVDSAGTYYELYFKSKEKGEE